MQEKLSSLKDPAQLREMNLAELETLAPALRARIIDVVSANGGHFASNLGTVELTLALLHRFDPYVDRVVWDVGHQTYSWKMLTGRYDDFESLRQENGLSGFPKREESVADAFNTGHSSTSISAALGIARGLKLRGSSAKSIAVIGDGALTGGLAYEALNNIDITDDNLIVIINDNQMSIDSNVGSISRHLSRIRVSRRYLKAKTGIEKILKHVPLIGKPIISLIKFVKTQVRRATVSEQSFFEDLGMNYYGPIDGHNIEELDKYLNVAACKGEPVILHIVTQKGRGYGYAEAVPSLYHGVAPFEIEVGLQQKREKQPAAAFLSDCTSYTSAFSQSMLKLSQTDDSIVAITAAMAQGTGLSAFAAKYPKRFFDVGIAEQHAVTMACGLATQGLKPVVAVYSSFLQRALDQVLHDAVLQKLHVVFCIDRAGIVGDDGETHQGLYDLSFLNALPGITVLAPSDYRSLYDMLSFALYQCKGPVVIRYPRGGQHIDSARLRRSQLRTPLPAAEILSTGQDLTIAAVGNMTGIALEAEARLREMNIHATVIDVRCLKPLDTDLILNSARSSGLLLTLEENALNGGLAQNLSLAIATQGEQIRVKAHAVGDHPVLQATQAKALENEGLSVNAIVNEVSHLILAQKQAIQTQ